ncbi:sugar ABC transporter ATP-binding protein [Tropicimonas sp. IMCC34043]|uniref:sugar ABC transporter ATP-binding protein n=1 Tax=Tropicimonas sp. IMCC34043 TaxID=2248760 RepID=UPI0018E4DFD7|nr:sugar ABC transporter ATP-binding protein [Tropicimonas sp. IMCC34043]
MQKMTERAEVTSALRIRNLSKSFGQTQALDKVSFEIRPGTIHGLLGGNGSGKSTLIKALAGVQPADHGGSFEFLGTTVSADHMTPELSRALGLRFVHQNPAVFPSMTVAENVAIGASFPTTAGKIRWKALRRHTQELLDRFEIHARAGDMVGDLRQAEQTMIAIARALQDADENAVSALVLDEPTASLPDHEVEILLDAVRRFAAAGHTIVYVSHRLDEVIQLTDDVTVLRDGRHVVTRPSEGLSESGLIELIVGHSLEKSYASAQAAPAPLGAPRLEVRNLSGGPLRDVSFDVGRGEVLGIAGLLGSGRTELLRMLFGDLDREGGTMTLDGNAVEFAEVREAMGTGVALVPEDRNREGVFQGLSVRQNLSIADLGRFTRAGRINGTRERQEVRQSINDYRIKTADDAALISSLSGGNQQKVVMARWLRRKPRLLLLDEPTQGVDVGAREDLYAAIRASLSDGMSVIAVSSDFDELAQICDRVVVLRDGCITAELRGKDITRQQMTHLVLASGKDAA